MILLAILILPLVAGLVVATYLLGFRLGSDNVYERIFLTRAAAIEAERRMLDLTKDAYAAMVDHVQRHRHNRR